LDVLPQCPQTKTTLKAAQKWQSGWFFMAISILFLVKAWSKAVILWSKMVKI